MVKHQFGIPTNQFPLSAGCHVVGASSRHTERMNLRTSRVLLQTMRSSSEKRQIVSASHYWCRLYSDLWIGKSPSSMINWPWLTATKPKKKTPTTPTTPTTHNQQPETNNKQPTTKNQQQGQQQENAQTKNLFSPRLDRPRSILSMANAAWARPAPCATRFTTTYPFPRHRDGRSKS